MLRLFCRKAESSFESKWPGDAVYLIQVWLRETDKFGNCMRLNGCSASTRMTKMAKPGGSTWVPSPILRSNVRFLFSTIQIQIDIDKFLATWKIILPDFIDIDLHLDSTNCFRCFVEGP